LEDLSAERRDQLLDEVVGIVTRYGMTVPAVFFAEMNKPLSFIGSQALHFFTPMIGAFVDESRVTEYALLFEDRENVERLLQKLETAARKN